jgi:hypothetical protein
VFFRPVQRCAVSGGATILFENAKQTAGVAGGGEFLLQMRIDTQGRRQSRFILACLPSAPHRKALGVAASGGNQVSMTPFGTKSASAAPSKARP